MKMKDRGNGVAMVLGLFSLVGMILLFAFLSTLIPNDLGKISLILFICTNILGLFLGVAGLCWFTNDSNYEGVK